MMVSPSQALSCPQTRLELRARADISHESATVCCGSISAASTQHVTVSLGDVHVGKAFDVGTFQAGERSSRHNELSSTVLLPAQQIDERLNDEVFLVLHGLTCELPRHVDNRHAWEVTARFSAEREQAVMVSH